jgi:hypothetical protein
MSFHARLLQQTADARAAMLTAPIIHSALRGDFTLASYLAFLGEAYHHVKHTVPLLAACRDALPERNHWMSVALAEYIVEEQGHDEWILDDIRACGADADAVRRGTPAHATEVMVAYAYDTIARGNPLGFFGMVQVLEGDNAIAKNRDLMGATDPKKADKGTIRADFADSIDANAVHGSDGPDTAKIEIAYFFPSLNVYSR